MATWENVPVAGHNIVEMILDDVSKQMGNSTSVRLSKGSNGQKAGSSMRVIKPSSASNSPRSSMGLGRRRTVMNDGAYRRRLVMMDQNLLAAGAFVSDDGPQVPLQTRPSRPVSWHPASHLSSQQSFQSYNTPAPEINPHYQTYNNPCTPSIYPGYASPESTFSPLSMPGTGYGQEEYYQHPQSSMPTSQLVTQQYFAPQTFENTPPQSIINTDSSMYSHFDWNNFATNGFENSTAPPTPENFLPIQHSEPAFPPEDSIPYHSLEDNESDDGEELIGMGLYDTPEISKFPAADPQLDNYRTFMMTSLLGSGYIPPRRPEPMGKGLKLEETWTPPDDEDEDDDQEDDDEQDGEGEEEEPEAKIEQQPHTISSHQREASPGRRNYAQYCENREIGRDGWL